MAQIIALIALLASSRQLSPDVNRMALFIRVSDYLLRNNNIDITRNIADEPLLGDRFSR